MLASPMVVGVIGGGLAWVQLPLAGFWLLGYLAFYATSVWLKSRRLPRHLRPMQVYALAAAATGLVVVWLQPGLLVWAPAFVGPLGVGLWAAAQHRERDLLSGLATVLGSCLIAVVAYDAGAGHVDKRAWLLAGVQFAYFAGTVFYVKSAIRQRGNRTFLGESVGFHAITTVAMAWLSPWLVLVFSLLTLRAWRIPLLGLTPKVIGIAEIAATVAVAAISLAVI